MEKLEVDVNRKHWALITLQISGVVALERARPPPWGTFPR